MEICANSVYLDTLESNAIDSSKFTQIREGKKAATNSLIEPQVSKRKKTIKHLILSVILTCLEFYSENTFLKDKLQESKEGINEELTSRLSISPTNVTLFSRSPMSNMCKY